MWPLKIDQIKRLQLELTTFCNAKCPSCERAKYNVLPEFIYKKLLSGKMRKGIQTTAPIYNKLVCLHG